MLNVSCPASLLTHFHAWNITEVERDLNSTLAASIIYAAVLLLVSCFLLFLGKRLVKPTLFLSALCSATVASFYLVDGLLTYAPKLSAAASCALLMSLPLVIGLLAGCLALWLLQLGFALLGAGAGAGLGYTLYNAGLDQIPVASKGFNRQVGSVDVVFLVTLCASILLGLCLTCKFQKSLLIAMTSVMGAVGATAAIALLLAHASLDFLGQKFDHDQGSTRYVWVQPLLFLCLLALGLCVQCRHERTRKREEERTALRPAQVPLVRHDFSRDFVRP